MSRIIIVSEIFYPETTSTGYYVSEIAEALAQRFEVTAICGRPASVVVPSCEQRRGVRIRRVGRLAARESRIVVRIISAASRAIAMSLWILATVERGDIVLVLTNPPLLPPCIALVCRLRSVAMVALVHDVYPDAAAASGVVSRKSYIYKLLERIQRWTLAGCTRVICLGRDMSTLLAARYFVRQERLCVITNWAEECASSSVRSRFGAAFGRPGRFTVLHAGNLGRTHDLDTLIAAARQLQHCDSLQFLFALAGGVPAELAAAGGLLRNVAWGRMAPEREGQWDTLAAGTVVAISFKAGMTGVSVPSRMYNAMAAGKPIVAVADVASELALVVREHRIGWVVPPGDVDSLVAALLEAKERPDLVAEMGERASAVARNHYSREQVLKQYVDAFEGVIAEYGW